jgi:hypothetical protein
VVLQLVVEVQQTPQAVVVVVQIQQVAMQSRVQVVVVEQVPHL